MKPGIVVAVVLAAFGCTSLANADPLLLVNGSGVLTGARNVDVNGRRYDVAFVDGTCTAVFGGCDAVSDFDFPTFADALAAADALLDQVFLDVPSLGNFDTHPELTFGCSDPTMCVAAIPTGITGPGAVAFGALAINLPAFDVASNFNFIIGRDTSIDPQEVWARFTPTTQPTPEPASLVLLASGVSGIVLTRRRKNFSDRNHTREHRS